MRARPPVVALLFLGCLAAAGCGSRLDALRARYAHSMGCDESQASVSPAGDNRYEAHGCGTSIVYTCQGALGQGADGCSEGGDRPATEPPPLRQNAPGTDPALPMPQ